MANRRGSLTEQIRRAAGRQTAMTQNALARAAGIDRGALSRFIRGERGLSLAKVDALAEVLGLRIVADQPPSARKKKGMPK